MTPEPVAKTSDFATMSMSAYEVEIKNAKNEAITVTVL